MRFRKQRNKMAAEEEMRIKRELFSKDEEVTECLCGHGNDPVTKEILTM